MNALRYGALGIALIGAAVFAGCGVGDVGSPASGTVLGTTPAPAPTVATAAGCTPPACQNVPLPESPHILRLTNAQWETTTRDLMRLAVQPGNSANFTPDPQSSSAAFGIDASSLYVDGDRWSQYHDAAVAVAQLVVGDDTKRNALLPAAAQDTTQTDDVRYAAFIADFLPRAYRRPVTTTETTEMTTVSQTFATSAVSGDSFQNRVLATIEATLQSPYYLYRIYGGVDTVTNGRARLTAYELAAKLAYGLWGTMPDDGLVAHAANGDLATNGGVADVAKEMLADPRAAANLVAFHDELYATQQYAGNLTTNARDIVQFPNYYDAFANDVVKDIELSVQEIVFNEKGGLRDLDTSRVAFVNQALAPVYGIDPSTINWPANSTPDTFVQVQMDPTRTGILMHPGWLAFEGTGTEPSTIHRGVYVARHVVCQALGSPPAAAAGADPSKAAGNTNRDRVIATTHPCGDGCHGGPTGVINPLGFGFENFDSIGKLRTTDDGYPVDTSSTVLIGGQQLTYADGPTMFAQLASSPQVHACYAAHWLAYLNNATAVDITPSWLTPALNASLTGSVEDMLLTLVQADAFLTVSR